jgi:ribokinase
MIGGDFATYPGGKGANQAVAAARLGAEVHLLGRVGDDAFGRVLRANLAKNGVNTRFVGVSPAAATGTAMILLQKGGENSIVLSPGANLSLRPADIDAAWPALGRAAFVLLQLEIPLATACHAVDLCRRHGIRTILDPAPAPQRLPAALLGVDILSPNETEAATILGARRTISPRRTLQRLLRAGAKSVVLKLGKHGSMHGSATDFCHVEGFKVRVVDTTAAGDCFTAALAVALAEGMDTAAALRFANAAGALACTVAGAGPSLPTRHALARLL